MVSSKATLKGLSADLASGSTKSRELVEACLSQIENPEGEGSRAFIHVDRQAALAQADAMDKLRSHGAEPSRYAGIPISVKDLFDVRGQVTKAGAAVLSDAPPATEDAPVIARLRRAGFVLIGRTNMSEFAFSGLGLNPHFDTPRNPWERAAGRVPGGSTSGGAVSVADGMSHATLGTDTGGSSRIPAAFTGIVGFKPTARRIPTAGAVPLSTTLDSVGPLGRSVECCAIMDAVISDEPEIDLSAAAVDGLRLAVPKTLMLDSMDKIVARDFERTLAKLSQAGARITLIDIPEFADIASINSKGGFTAAESFAWHRKFLKDHPDRYDPRIKMRIERGQHISAAEYIDLTAARQAYITGVTKRIHMFNALIFPTVPIVAPKLSELADDDAFTKLNLLVLRNSTTINFLDGCAVSLPMHEHGNAPTGLTIAGIAMDDKAILRHAAAIEEALSAPRL
jgi:aspartyl-tRNA(Asn)/glutamyl-tRNA(Gln) amidotransferase subunit A